MRGSGQFSDVPPGSTFYPQVECLACAGIITGYVDGTFRPYNNVTRAQTAKIVANAAGFTEPVSGQTFTDVPPSYPFYLYIERLARRGILGGYDDPQQCPSGVPCFLPYNDVTRGQIAKIVYQAVTSP